MGLNKENRIIIVGEVIFNPVIQKIDCIQVGLVYQLFGPKRWLNAHRDTPSEHLTKKNGWALENVSKGLQIWR